MALQTYKIELRTDFNDKHKDKLAEHAIRQMAHELITTMMLLADGRKPQIAIETSDMFAGTKEVLLFDPGSKPDSE
jgi:hypothetical protein